MPRRDDSKILDSFLELAVPKHLSYEISYRTHVIRPGKPVEGLNGGTLWSRFLLMDCNGRHKLELTNPRLDPKDPEWLMTEVAKHFQENPSTA